MTRRNVRMLDEFAQARYDALRHLSGDHEYKTQVDTSPIGPSYSHEGWSLAKGLIVLI